MANIEITRGSRRTINQINNMNRSIRQQIRRGWFKAGDELSKELNDQVLKKPRAGRVYIRKIKGGRTRRHIASRPGETPANMTGEYRKSRGYQITGWQQMEFGVRDPKSVFLEDGTRKMAPRPGVQNTVNAKQNQVRNDIESLIRGIFRD